MKDELTFDGDNNDLTSSVSSYLGKKCCAVVAAKFTFNVYS